MNQKLKYNIFTYLCIAFSGIHFFMSPLIVSIFAMIILFFFTSKLVFNTRIILYLFSLIFLIISQSVIFETYIIIEYLSIIINYFLMPYFLCLILKENFVAVYVKIFYYICIISLFFYVPSVLSEDFLLLINQIPKTLNFLDNSAVNNQFILHSVSHSIDNTTGLIRHNGIFHEPGVFGIFILIGLFFNYLINKRVFNKYGCIFLLCGFTTFSTACYLSLTVFFMGFQIVYKKNQLYRTPIIIILLILAGSYYFNSNLMHDKIVYEFNIAMSKDMFEKTGGRFYGARKNIYVLQQYPLHGRGFLPSSKPDDTYDIEYTRYGILKNFANIGIVLSIFFMIYLKKGISYVSHRYNEKILGNIFLLSLLIILFSQSFTFSPIILYFLFMGLFTKKSLINEN